MSALVRHVSLEWEHMIDYLVRNPLIYSFLSISILRAWPLQLTLPANSTAFPSVDGEPFSSSRRWFDFSDAVMPLPEFDQLASNPGLCPRDGQFRDGAAYSLDGAYSISLRETGT